MKYKIHPKAIEDLVDEVIADVSFDMIYILDKSDFEAYKREIEEATERISEAYQANLDSNSGEIQNRSIVTHSTHFGIENNKTYIEIELRGRIQFVVCSDNTAITPPNIMSKTIKNFSGVAYLYQKDQNIDEDEDRIYLYYDFHMPVFIYEDDAIAPFAKNVFDKINTVMPILLSLIHI